MSTVRTETINALENVIYEAKVILDKSLVLNLLIRERKLPIEKIDVTAVYRVQQAAEVMLREMELRAGVAA